MSSAATSTLAQASTDSWAAFLVICAVLIVAIVIWAER